MLKAEETSFFSIVEKAVATHSIVIRNKPLPSVWIVLLVNVPLFHWSIWPILPSRSMALTRISTGIRVSH